MPSGASPRPPRPADRTMTPVSRRAAVIGKPIAHSLSPILHRAAYGGLGLAHWRYERLEVESSELARLLAELSAPAVKAPVWAGVSVTMPHKQAIVAMLDVVDPLAMTVGAVNTVVAQRDHAGPALLAGFNTDVAGVVGALRDAGEERPGPPITGDATAVVLGSGATACSALAALAELGVERIVVAARSHGGPGRALSAAHRMGLDIETLFWRPGGEDSDIEVARAMAGADVVVSTLPARTADPLARALKRVGGLRAGGARLLDVVYSPWPTALAGQWRALSGRTVPGWLMLLHQAVPQVRLMTGREPDLDLMRSALEAELAGTGGLGPG